MKLDLNFDSRAMTSFVPVICVLLLGASALADAPGSPGIPHTWAPARKDAVGTAYEPHGSNHSPLWFTVAEGIVTETFYPSADQAQNGDLQFIVTDPGTGFFSEQRRDVAATVQFDGDGSAVLTQGTDRTGTYSISQSIVTDHQEPVLRVKAKIKFLHRSPTQRLFVLWKPALQNQGSHLLGHATATALTAEPSFNAAFSGNLPRFGFAPSAAVLTLAGSSFKQTSAGYVGTSDGWQQLEQDRFLRSTWSEAGPGSVALVGEVPLSDGDSTEVELALGYGPTATTATATLARSLARGFADVFADYESGWKSYLARLDASLAGAPSGALHFLSDHPLARRSVVTLKMHGDKSSPGALVASLSNPAVPSGERAQDAVGGYHLVWPRDLYHSAMGLLASGDVETARDVLDTYIRTQKSDGSWSQNFFVDGGFYWNGLQMDQVGFPILLAYQLDRRGILFSDPRVQTMIRKAADFIAARGPVTQQDRWEEIGGFVPHTIGTEIAALAAASRLLNDSTYLTSAKAMSANLENWTLVHRGFHGQNYYLRVSPTGHPDSHENLMIANGAGPAHADELLDGGFLELVRMGVRSFDDPSVISTLQLYDSSAHGVAGGNGNYASGGEQYLRYNRDGYGVDGHGGFWPLLAGERGHYALRAGDFSRAMGELSAMEQSALPSGLIPEQVMNPIANSSVNSSPNANVGAGVATPLAWAHAELILLYRSLEEKAVFDRVESGQ